ncbi:MAG: type IV pilus modification protein PilV [Thiohalospira sp.]
MDDVHMPSPAHPPGYTLVEVMVAIAILGIGVVGLVGLQADSARYQNTTYHQTLATLLARDLAERIRANPEAAASGDYAGDGTGNDPDCVGGACTPSQLADFDLAAWRQHARDRLPSAWVDSSRSGDTYTLRIGWGSASSADDCEPTTCVSLRVTP